MGGFIGATENGYTMLLTILVAILTVALFVSGWLAALCHYQLFP